MALILTMLLSFSALSMDNSAIIGRGFHTLTQTYKESPFVNIKFAHGTSKADINFTSKIREHEFHDDVQVKLKVGIGNKILGAEVSGGLSLKKNRVNKLYSLTLTRKLEQSYFLTSFELDPELKKHLPLDWQDLSFAERYGDGIIYSATVGSELQVFIVAEYIHDRDITEIDLKAKASFLLKSFTVFRKKEFHDVINSDDFRFSIYLNQKGGDTSLKDAFIAQHAKPIVGDFAQCLKIMDAVYDYAFGTNPTDFSKQQSEEPYVFNKDILSYGNKSEIAWMWM